MEMRHAYADCLRQLMEEDPRVVLLDADLSKASGTLPLHKGFPKQTLDCGIQEANMASVAAGLASYGYKPWIESFAVFASRRILDQITISIAYAGRNVKIVGTDPGIGAELNGGTHMAVMDINALRGVPGMVIFEPVDECQLRKAMPVLNAYEGPVYIRLFRKNCPDVFPEDYVFDLFKADLLREGTDVTLFATGIEVKEALDAAEILEKEGVSAEVINVHTLKPIDRETVLASVRKTGCAVTAENHSVIGGLHSAVLEALAEEKIPVTAVGFRDCFGEVGKIPYLREKIGLTAEHIVKEAHRALELK